MKLDTTALWFSLAWMTAEDDDVPDAAALLVTLEARNDTAPRYRSDVARHRRGASGAAGS